jgi:hypothetical protein
LFEKKLQAVKDRSGMNIKSGRVMMQVKDRDWLFTIIENQQKEIEQLKVEKDKWFKAFHNQIMKPF